MYLIEVSIGKTYPIEILPLENSDYKLLSKTRYFFHWKEKTNQETYKLVMRGQNEIQGLVSVERIPSEWRIHIREPLKTSFQYVACLTKNGNQGNNELRIFSMILHMPYNQLINI